MRLLLPSSRGSLSLGETEDLEKVALPKRFQLTPWLIFKFPSNQIHYGDIYILVPSHISCSANVKLRRHGRRFFRRVSYKRPFASGSVDLGIPVADGEYCGDQKGLAEHILLVEVECGTVGRGWGSPRTLIRSPPLLKQVLSEQ